MPKIVYKPEGAEEAQTWEFKFGRLMSPERIVIEKLTGIASWDEVQNQFWANSTPVIHALLYVLMKREMPVLKPTDVVFCDDDYELDPSYDEKLAMLDAAQNSPDAAQDPELAADLAKLRAEIEAEAADPKAPEV